jgi:hypothetical protein
MGVEVLLAAGLVNAAEVCPMWMVAVSDLEKRG